MKSQVKLGPYSRVFHRGVIADSIDGRSRDGRLMRHMEAELVKHVGGSPSVIQRMLIERLVKIRMQLDLLDQKLATGWTAHDSRTYGALLNAHRLCARELGAQPAAKPTMSLSAALEKKRAHRETAA